MASQPLTTIDWQPWSALGAYPLELAGDGDRATPELVLEGQLGPRDGPAGAYAYAFSLQENIDYRFLSSGAQNGFDEFALLADPATGEVYWGNAAALSSLGLDPALENLTLQLDSPKALTLVVANAGEGEGGAFHLDLHADAPAYTDDAIYRFAKLSDGMYFYVAGEAMRDLILHDYPDFRFEGQVFVGDAEVRPGYVPVHRFANVQNGSYFYTASEAERGDLLANHPEMRYEGVGFYVPPEGPDTLPVYRLQNVNTGGYLFTTNPAEKLYALLQGGWQDQGVAFQSDATLDPAAPVPSGSDSPPVELVGTLAPQGEMPVSAI